MPALLFGSISTLADTSELQRESFNAAFAAHGLHWNWSQPEYRTLLASSGGAARIAAYAEGRGETVDAAAVHRTKSELFQQRLADSSVAPRDGVLDTIAQARAAGYQVGFVTTTSPENVSALFQALTPTLAAADFDVVVDVSKVDEAKPEPDAYQHALRELGVEAATSVAIEDNPGGTRAAIAAGVVCVAFPNENTREQDFAGAAATVDRLDFPGLRTLLPTA